MVYKKSKMILSDMSFLKLERHNNGDSYVYCEHYPRQNVARRQLISGVVTSSGYCSYCKLQKECLIMTRRFING